MRKASLLLLLLVPGLTGFGGHVIDQKDRTFSQSGITVKVGETITFTNSDEVAHNVYSKTPTLEFDLARQAPGGKSEISFKKAGMVEVHCSIHPKMKLLVTVVK